MAASMLERSWEQMLDSTKQHGLSLIEACSGGHISKAHYDPICLASDQSEFDAFGRSLEEREMRITTNSSGATSSRYLRRVGYDGPVCIECEEPCLAVENR